jgi:hypothetical protein
MAERHGVRQRRRCVRHAEEGGDDYQLATVKIKVNAEPRCAPKSDLNNGGNGQGAVSGVVEKRSIAFDQTSALTPANRMSPVRAAHSHPVS